MKERSISYSAEMIHARRAGRKTQTRRVVNPQPTAVHGQGGNYAASYQSDGDGRKPLICPYGQPGDRLVVKEAAWMWCAKLVSRTEVTKKTGKPKVAWVACRNVPPIYCADHPAKPAHVPDGMSAKVGNLEYCWHKKNARFLPRWASRGLDEIVSIRIERLQDISEADAIAEGIVEYHPPDALRKAAGRWWHLTGTSLANKDPRIAYWKLWESINGPGSWERNDWVWVIESKIVEGGASV